MIHGGWSLEVLEVIMMADAGVVIQSAVGGTWSEFLVLHWIPARHLLIVVGCVFASVGYLVDPPSCVSTVACRRSLPRSEFLVLHWISVRLLLIVVGYIFASVVYLVDPPSCVSTVACGATARGWAMGLTCVSGDSSSGG